MMGCRCSSCGEALGSLKPGHLLRRRSWALPPLVFRAERLAGMGVVPIEQCAPVALEAASALLESVMAPRPGGV